MVGQLRVELKFRALIPNLFLFFLNVGWIYAPAQYHGATFGGVKPQFFIVLGSKGNSGR